MTAKQIYNTETGLLQRCPPTSTLARILETLPKGFKQNKDHISVVVCTNSAGMHKVGLSVVGKYRKP